MTEDFSTINQSSKREKKYVLSRLAGLKLFLFLIILALIIFGIFYLIQEKKDDDFEKHRVNIQAFKESFKK